MPSQPIQSGDSLLSALLLAATGGMLDAIVYLTHGHVFANAMTGNVVLLGVSALNHDWAQALRHLIPITAFLAGILAAKACRELPERNAIILGLLFEIAALGGAGALPNSFPQLAFVAIVAFPAAFQVANFRRVRRFAYNTTFVTGNLRDMAEGAFDGLRPGLEPAVRAAGRSQAIALALVCGAFLSGVVAGAWVGPHLQNRALWCALPLLGVVTALSFQKKD